MRTYTLDEIKSALEKESVGRHQTSYVLQALENTPPSLPEEAKTVPKDKELA